ncbi:MAG: hypothetical protein COT25_00570 [Candidatus Kerfeldbacteria bacterium CG08_land_8_20_14_0_20_42_7]|uniref:Bacterial type II secretion system protein E domain-containing protein n=1 Tax=Candidatus Kerfeldbacteria bacterium CG08_land_8_20_14_0_20_42_7 TaxID=2014245 RepID=A0A2H0YTT6_9BACT|nr:MAG: hypothetical protein COT25_00570 [Candidatus Kerfeldbacteria bacterium CG08_land_8_20_14_0_20_42_7]
MSADTLVQPSEDVATKMRTTSQKDVIDVLVEKKLLTAGQLTTLRLEAAKTGASLIRLIEQKKLVQDDRLARALSGVIGLEYADLEGKTIPKGILDIFPHDLAQNYEIIPLARDGNLLTIGMVDPTNFKAMEAVDFIARKNNFRVVYKVIAASGLRNMFKQYTSLTSEVEEALASSEEDQKQITGIESLNLEDKGMEEVVKTAPVTKMVSVILKHAVEGGASDIHIEPISEGSRVRYRIDGELHTSIILPPYVHSAIVARIKVLSNLKLDETRIPQDGRFRTTLEGKTIDLRVSTLPLMNQEKVVMRILDMSSDFLNLVKLGFMGRDLDILRASVKKSKGLILVTGPTGSGKSTSLYSLMSLINTDGINIVTLEDPIEYYIEGINQSQVNPEVGMTFASGLRAILRQDPDAIMVGEIRDSETAELAVHASLTGHIVFSTLHTNDAFGAIPRLIDMKLEPFLLASSLSLIEAQRLVRRICDHCREEFKLPADMLTEVMKEFETLDEKQWPDDIDRNNIKFYRGKGCSRCGGTGYKGRLVIDEVIKIDEIFQELIVNGFPMDQVRARAKEQGTMLLRQDGFIKTMRGLTTVEEVLRVTQV